MKKAMIDYMKNEKNDELYTPDYAIKPLLKYLPKNKIIWECTDFGNSNITKVLKENGYKVISHTNKNFDFLFGGGGGVWGGGGVFYKVFGD